MSFNSGPSNDFKVKRLFRVGLFGLVLLIALVWWCNRVVITSSDGLVFDKTAAIPETRTALLLGTSKSLSNGSPNQYFVNRITAAVDLYKAGKVKAFVISGDNSRVGYDEPTDMKADLIKAGIDSTVIYLDYAGFRTYDSVYRLREIFGQSKAVVISQEFHNRRTIYIGKKLGVELIGYNAKDVETYYGLRTQLREYLARVKVIIDCTLRFEPHFLGEKIEI
jgi:SanA protein